MPLWYSQMRLYPQTVSGVTVWFLRALAAYNIQGSIIIPVRVTFPIGSEPARVSKNC